MNLGDGKANALPTVANQIVAIAASAGGLKALSAFLAGLPATFPAPILIVQHIDPKRRSLMAEILSRRTKLVVKQASNKERLVNGTVFFAPPNFHMLVDHQHSIELTQTELVHFVRPSADILFASIAKNFGKQAIAVVLTGSGSDGAEGVIAIKEKGGKVIVQSKESADFPSMPSAAIETKCADYILPLEGIPPLLCELVALNGNEGSVKFGGHLNDELGEE